MYSLASQQYGMSRGPLQQNAAELSDEIGHDNETPDTTGQFIAKATEKKVKIKKLRRTIAQQN